MGLFLINHSCFIQCFHLFLMHQSLWQSVFPRKFRVNILTAMKKKIQVMKSILFSYLFVRRSSKVNEHLKKWRKKVNTNLPKNEILQIKRRIIKKKLKLIEKESKDKPSKHVINSLKKILHKNNIILFLNWLN